MRLIGRIIWVAIAFLIAALVAAGVAAIIGLEQLTRVTIDQTGPDATAVDRWLGVFDQLVSVWKSFTGPTLLAPLLVVIGGEVMRLRSFWFYLLGGGLALAGMPALMRLHETATAAGPVPAVLVQTLAAAGLTAGAVYWLLAGRQA